MPNDPNCDRAVVECSFDGDLEWWEEWGLVGEKRGCRGEY
jgi:hypothetical protein